MQWAAIILSALADLYAARKRGMDFFGSMVIAFIVSLGGGTLRDRPSWAHRVSQV